MLKTKAQHPCTKEEHINTEALKKDEATQCHLVVPAQLRDLPAMRCTLVHTRTAEYLPATSQSVPRVQDGTPCPVLPCHTCQLSTWEILPQMQTYRSSVHGQKPIIVFSLNLVRWHFHSKYMVFVQLRAGFSPFWSANSFQIKKPQKDVSWLKWELCGLREPAGRWRVLDQFLT